MSHLPRFRRKAVRTRWQRAILEAFEPRVLLSGTYLTGNFTGSWVLGGLSKAGSLTSDGTGDITAGTWTNEDGSSDTLVVADTGSAYTVGSLGSVDVTLDTTVGSSVLSGLINSTRDVIALNELSGGVPTFDGLDVLVNHTGTFAAGDLTATWNIAARDFRGTITINAAGHVTGGQIFLESNQKSAKIKGGTAVLNADGTGTLTFTTGFGASTGFASISLNLAMNSSKDTMVGTNAAIGQPASAPQTGTVPAELGVLTKTAGTYSSADVRGVTWTIHSALGEGTFMFNSDGTINGTLATLAGTLETLTGNYSVGGNGTVITNITATAGPNVTHFSLSGAINRSRNLIALGRAITNPGSNSGLTILTSATNRAPTERAKAVLPLSAYQSSAITIDFPTLATATSVNDFDHDTVSFLITAVPIASGSLTITHGGIASAVTIGSTVMVSGDTLTWTPAATAKGDANAFSIQATDGQDLAANATKIFVNTTGQPLVSALSNEPFALEAEAGTTKGNAVVTIQRSGGIAGVPTTVTLSIAGTAALGTNYSLAGATILGTSTDNITTATVVIPSGKNSANLVVHPLDDGIVDPTLTVNVTVAPDPNASSSSYTPSVHATAHVQVIDKAPLVAITAKQPSILEGNASVNTFIITRLPAQGGNVNGSQTVDLAYSGSFDTADDLIAPSSVTFGPGEVKKVVRVTTIDNGIADPTQTLTATISGSGFAISGPDNASVNVLDASPVVSVSVDNATAQESNPAKVARFVVHRTGSTADPLVVDFSTAAGGTFGTLGTNYTLSSQATSVTILAGKHDAVVTLTAIDDGINDPTLHPAVTLEADAGPTYHIGTHDQVTMNILNDDRRPTIANGTVSQNTTMNVALNMSYSQLVTLIGAALAPGETNGTLQLTVTAEFKGTLQLIPNGSLTPTAAVVGTVIDSGDTLVWTPPVGRNDVTLEAFSLGAVDGTQQSAMRSKFSVVIA